jgi:predicted lipid-binding transport protein (Tim44 family)
MYNPKNVGNDASARPWEMGGMATAETSKGLDSSPKTIPNPFEPERLRQADQAMQEARGAQDALLDVEAFKAMAKEQFLNLQDAWDRLDMNRLELFLSPDMFTLVKGQFALRATGPQKTEVMMLQAQWLGVEHVQGQSVASVELSGMSREAQEVSFTPFREIWSWTRPLAQDHATWLVCGLEPLQ